MFGPVMYPSTDIDMSTSTTPTGCPPPLVLLLDRTAAGPGTHRSAEASGSDVELAVLRGGVPVRSRPTGAPHRGDRRPAPRLARPGRHRLGPDQPVEYPVRFGVIAHRPVPGQVDPQHPPVVLPHHGPHRKTGRAARVRY